MCFNWFSNDRAPINHGIFFFLVKHFLLVNKEKWAKRKKQGAVAQYLLNHFLKEKKGKIRILNQRTVKNQPAAAPSIPPGYSAV